MSYLINKKHLDESVVSIKELDGYQFKPKANKDSYIKVNQVTIVDRVMIDKILTMCRDFGNSRGKLDETNFPRILENHNQMGLILYRTNIRSHLLRLQNKDKSRQGHRDKFYLTL